MATKASSSLAAVANGAAIPVDYKATGASPIGVQLDFITGTGVATVSVQGTMDDVLDASVTPVWFGLTGLTGLTAGVIASVAIPVKAVRLACTAYTSGSVTMKVVQGSNN